VKMLQKPGDRGETRHTVEVHIEELFLHGSATGDRYEIAEAVERELSRLMSEGEPMELRKNPVSLKRIDAGAFHVQAGSKARITGIRIAQAVYRSLRQQTRTPAGPRVTRHEEGVRQR
jgi:hypothetical protein